MQRQNEPHAEPSVMVAHTIKPMAEAVRIAIRKNMDAPCDSTSIIALPSRIPAPTAAETPTPHNFPLTDLGNAERVVHHFGDDIRYCAAARSWLIWNCSRWVWDGQRTIIKLAAKTARRIPHEADGLPDSEQRAKLLKHAINSESKHALEAMVNLAQPMVPISVGELDADPMLLGVHHGIVDLRAGETRKPCREDYITKQANVSYTLNAECPTFLAFLNDIFVGDAEAISFIQRLCGYLLTGDTREQVVIIFYGHGKNGKTTLIRILEIVLHDYANAVDPQTFTEKRNPGGPSPELAELRGARLVTTVEPNKDCELDEALIKRVTGQDRISCRPLYQNPISYIPQFKVVMASNHKPKIKGTDEGIWRRIILVPFDYKVPESKTDSNLLDKLRAELPGIFSWMLAGCLEWQKHGLGIPENIQMASTTYRQEMDIFEDWLAECCKVGDDCGPTSFGALFDSFSSYCEREETSGVSKKAFGQRLEQKGFPEKRTAKERQRQGIRLRFTPGMTDADLFRFSDSEPDTGDAHHIRQPGRSVTQ